MGWMDSAMEPTYCSGFVRVDRAENKLHSHQFRHEIEVAARFAVALEAVADPEDRFDVGVAIGEKFLAEPSNMDI